MRVLLVLVSLVLLLPVVPAIAPVGVPAGCGGVVAVLPECPFLADIGRIRLTVTTGDPEGAAWGYVGVYRASDGALIARCGTTVVAVCGSTGASLPPDPQLLICRASGAAVAYACAAA